MAVSLAAQQGRFRAGVELVSLNVTVTDGTKYITGLDQDDFEVFEDGAKQDITFFSQAQQPIALAVLLDTSNSMEDRLATAQEAAIGFVRRMQKRRRDRSDRVQQPGARSRSRSRTTRPRSKRRSGRRPSTGRPRSTTPSTSRCASSRRSAPRTSRRSGARRSSSCPTATTRRASSSTTRCWTSRSDPRRRSTRSGSGRGRPGRPRIQGSGVRPAAAVAGDRRPGVLPDSVAELPKIYEQISDELASQYSIAYTSSNPMRNGAWRRMDVRIDKPGLTARTRQGYYAPDGSVGASVHILPARCCTPPPPLRTSLHFARRDPRVGRLATATARRRASSRTRSSSACRRCRPGTRRWSARARRFRRSCGCSGCRISTSS